ncbi:alpha/beta hydrolase domain-containing protein [Bradyrhizobium barranii]|uniref:alpha/beta hydrolase domain-containing protein n=1 Tax=Bradyrhizobium barranii TaxID=2992140 RepID=UPI0024B08F86|nr:alpha/beta hydrolase domain-containing protein [Bradyrhizobium barranii]WFT96852.1 alpha/beta hydrolase domain-containing protein [Bradyrhizobium barranii]
MTNKIVIEIKERESFAGGHHFDQAGAYERLRGCAHFAVSPDAGPQAGILDLHLAPRNEDGLVEFFADFLILKPVEPSRGNGRLFYDCGNRGNMRSLQFFNDAPANNDPKTVEDAGNGFLFRRGYTLLWSAWQGGILRGHKRVVLNVPVATNNGEPITGTVLQDFSVDKRGSYMMPLSGRTDAHSYSTTTLNTRNATLSRRRYPYSEREDIDPDGWQFGRIEGGTRLDDQRKKIGIVPSYTHLLLQDGFEPGWIYELIYTAKDPLVLGLGYVALRDLVSFMRYDEEDSAGRLNPIGRMEKAYAWGRSQTGRFLRDFIYHGFNADKEGRRVFDGVMPHVSGAGLVKMNRRFANVFSPSGGAYQHRFCYGDLFPFSYAETTDHLTGASDAILKRPSTDPLVIHTHTSTEYWQRRGSLVHTDTRGQDLKQPENVRIYHWTSSQHSANPRLVSPKQSADVVNLINNVYTSPFFRAMLDAMDAWASDGLAPPDSSYPTIEAGTLVSFAKWATQFPNIQGQMLPEGPLDLPLMDFGPKAAEGVLSSLPPVIVDREGYMILVPSVDEDGNECDGVKAPMAAVPLGTYTGWNILKRGNGHGAISWLTKGSYIPFPDTPDEQRATRDPRKSVLERYGSSAAYVRSVRDAAERLVRKRFMIEEDVDRVLARASNWGRPRTDVRLSTDDPCDRRENNV